MISSSGSGDKFEDVLPGGRAHAEQDAEPSRRESDALDMIEGMTKFLDKML
jgi:hypothetical protein